MKDHKTNGVGS